jgi:hypothetical protein
MSYILFTAFGKVLPYIRCSVQTNNPLYLHTNSNVHIICIIDLLQNPNTGALRDNTGLAGHIYIYIALSCYGVNEFKSCLLAYIIPTTSN